MKKKISVIISVCVLISCVITIAVAASRAKPQWRDVTEEVHSQFFVTWTEPYTFDDEEIMRYEQKRNSFKAEAYDSKDSEDVRRRKQEKNELCKQYEEVIDKILAAGKAGTITKEKRSEFIGELREIKVKIEDCGFENTSGKLLRSILGLKESIEEKKLIYSLSEAERGEEVFAKLDALILETERLYEDFKAGKMEQKQAREMRDDIFKRSCPI